ncbi:Gfo/Idh/MocA family oxidoreductase [Virgibacillus sp. 179-BFC.A HS]|uniref:Gfo/Idh/MocA family oxidoreductase n=1 Tax=Tigheibacillus jepli TaxID=3035914 RepID=A0ABU5CL53_9BACI|nr:Gfo/Idh/MocA family oxidoreductase [Virgibacillus sp. 179-BFC.A HS]MDY0406955.1 Gfo/Idh/MocA family oxidoreductase [Virgibacillus sp. 179-BFC.A HS]
MKFSTIGTSWITEKFIESAKTFPDLELESVYSRNEEKAMAFAKVNGAKHWYTNLQEMLEDGADFVYIASPNILHAEHVLTLLEKGKHVFCEKPLAYTEEQMKRIMALACDKQTFVLEGYRHLFSPNYQRLKDNLSKVGKIRSALLQYIQYSSRYDAFKAGKISNVFSKEFAGGALMDLGVYPLSMTIDLFGEPTDVAYYPVLLNNGVDGSGTLIVSYPEFIVTIMTSKIAQGTIPSEIHGEDGTLTVDHIAPIEKISLSKKGSKEIEELAIDQNELDMVYEIAAFKKMVEENDTELCQAYLERSLQVAKWTEKARLANDIIFPNT